MMNEPNMEDWTAGAEEMLGTANERFKKDFPSWFWGSMIVAAVGHFGVFKLWPDLQAEDVSVTVREIETVDITPEIEIPPPPAAVARPATPVIVADAVVDDDLTIALTSLDANPVENLAPPPDQVAVDVSQAFQYTPMDVRPSNLNADEVKRALDRAYPSILKDAGIGGTVDVNFYIDENGKVVNAYVRNSSGHTSLDEAAISVAHVFRFSPAMNRDKRVAVWVWFPIKFEAN